MGSPNRSARFAWLQRVPFTREGLLWLLIAAAMLVTGLLKGINLIILIACWLVTLLVWNWWLARRQLRRLEVSRAVPDFVFAQIVGDRRDQLIENVGVNLVERIVIERCKIFSVRKF